MALNFLGLGFSFGAKDAGLKNKQRQVASGFGNISDEVEKMGARAESGTKPLGRMTDQLSGSAMDKLTESIDTLAMSLGKDLPKASRKGADSLHRSTASIESNERRIGGGFDFIRGSYEKLTSILSVNKIQAFLQAISLSKLGDIGSGLKNLATSSTNLTTSLEATITTAAKTSRQMGANFGLAGKSLGRFTGEATSMGIALNIGTEKAGEAVYQITLATKELGAVGIKSAADLAKFAEVSGVSATEVTQIFKKAGQQFGLTGDQLKQLAGAALQSGTQLGDIGGQFKQMPQIMELISRRAAVMGKKFDPKKMADFASQTLALSGAFYQMGESADDARELATGFATKMVESGEDFAGMFAGTKNELNDFMMGIGIAGGDINKAFEAMSKGPGEFMTTMGEMVMNARKDGKLTEGSMNQLRARLSETFGPKQAAAMMNFFSKVDEKQLAAMKSTSKATGDLGKFAKAGFSTGRTLAESFDLMEQKFIMSFRNIGRAAATDFVKKTGEEFNKFNKQMAEVVKKGGPLGKFVEKLSEMHQIGALALIPQTLRPMASVFGTMVKEAAPMIGVLGALGFRLNMLVSPFTLVLMAATALGIWFASLRMEGKSTGEAIKIMSAKIAAGAKKLWMVVKGWMKKLFEFLSSVDWGAVFTKIFDALVFVMKEAGALLRQIPWKQIFQGILKAVGKIFQFLASKEFADILVKVFEFLGETIVGLAGVLISAFQKMFEALANIDIGKVAAQLVDTLGRIFTVVGRAIKGIFEKLLDLFEYTASAGFRDKLMKIAEGVAVGVRALINKLFDLFGAAVDYIMSIDLGKVVENVLMTAANLVAAALHVVISALETFVSRIPEFIGKAFDLLIKFLKEVPAAIGRFLTQAGEMIGPLMKRLVVAILDGLWAIISSIPGLVKKAFMAIPDIIKGIGTLIKGAIDFIFKAILGVFDAIEAWLVKTFPSAAKVIQVIFAAIKAIITAVWKVIKFVVDAIVVVFQVLWKVVGGILKALWWAFDTFILTPLGWIWKGIKALASGIGWVIGKIVDAVKAVGSFLGKVGGFFASIGSKIAGVFGGSNAAITKALEEAAKKQKAASEQMTESQRKAMEEMARQKAKFEEKNAAWEKERAVLEVQHKKDLEDRRLTYKTVVITAENAAEVTKMASDAAAKGIKDNILLVEEQVRVASTLAMPKMEQSYLDAIKTHKEMQAAYDAAYKAKDLDKMTELGDAHVEFLKNSRDQFGVTAGQLSELRDEQMKSFTINEKLIGKMNVDQTKAYQTGMDQIFDKYMKEQMAAMQMTRFINEQSGAQYEALMRNKEKEMAGLGQFDLKRVDIDKKYYLLTNELSKKNAEDQAKNEQKILQIKSRAAEEKMRYDLAFTSTSKQLYEELAKTQMSTSKNALDYMGALQRKFSAEVAEATKAIPESMKSTIDTVTADLNAWYFSQLRAIQTNTTMTLDQQKAALDKLESDRASKMTEFRAMVDEQGKLMAASSGANLNEMTKKFDDFTSKIKSTTDEAALKASAAVGTAQKELGVSATDALTNLKDIAAIDPKKFASDLKVIKQVYIDFAKVAQEQSKEMLVATNKAFEEFNKVAIEHWTKQKANISMMAFSEDDLKKLGATIGAQVDRIFSMLTKLIAEKVQAAIGEAFVKAFAKVLDDAKKFTKDAMEIFRDLTKQMVKAFGDAWAKILEFTANAINAIEKDVARAVANLKRIEAAMRSSSAQSNVGADVKQDVKMDTTGGKDKLDNLFQATHHPEWYENDFKYKAMEIISALNALASALAAAPRGGGVQTNSARVRAGIKADADVGGPGANRANARVSGGQK